MIEIKPLTRRYMPKDFTVTTWEALKPYITELYERPINSFDEYNRWLEDESEMSAVLAENGARRYVRMTCNTADKDLEKAYNDFVENISPHVTEWAEKLNRKMVESPFAAQMTEKGFEIALRKIKTDIELFRVENIPLHTRETKLASESGQIRGAMTVILDGEEMTLQKAADRLFWTDRAKREEAWKAVRSRQYHDVGALDLIFDQLVDVRHTMAQNAGFKNYRDYVFKSMKRFDYTPQDCLNFHASVEKAVVPLLSNILEERKRIMKLDTLRPWDVAVDVYGRPPLKCFKSPDDLIDKAIAAVEPLDTLFSDTVKIMRQHDHLDVGSRKNKRPGGYMCEMHETGIPFIFANATEKVDDVVTMIHEIGHAVHEVQLCDLRLMQYKTYPIEMAELASMSMELISLDYWNAFLPDEEECRRAKYDHLVGIIEGLPWIAQIDAFQHEIYTQPQLETEQRYDVWIKLCKRLMSPVIDWSDFDMWLRTNWQRQGHLYENPFYYIEYGIAQLGALQVWRNYKQDKKQAVEQYKNALALGGTVSIPEMYETAGIKFDFSEKMLTELMAFVQKEMATLVD